MVGACSSSGLGMGWAAAARMTSATGAVPVMTWPKMSWSWVRRALRRRSSTGSMPSASASLSIWASAAKEVWTAPNPRMAPHGGLLVRTA
jgi:hypothetical protein